MVAGQGRLSATGARVRINRYIKETEPSFSARLYFFGGERGIRTLAGTLAPLTI